MGQGSIHKDMSPSGDGSVLIGQGPNQRLIQVGQDHAANGVRPVADLACKLHLGLPDVLAQCLDLVPGDGI